MKLALRICVSALVGSSFATSFYAMETDSGGRITFALCLVVIVLWIASPRDKD